jgi:hypothetical protein
MPIVGSGIDYQALMTISAIERERDERQEDN